MTYPTPEQLNNYDMQLSAHVNGSMNVLNSVIGRVVRFKKGKYSGRKGVVTDISVIQSLRGTHYTYLVHPINLRDGKSLLTDDGRYKHYTAYDWTPIP